MERERSFADIKIPRTQPDPDQVTYYVYGVDSVTTIKAHGFKVIEGALVFTGRNNNILRVFASGVWKQIVLEGENNDTGY